MPCTGSEMPAQVKEDSVEVYQMMPCTCSEMPSQVKEDSVELYKRMPLLRDASPGKGGLCGGVPEDAIAQRCQSR